jgi:hypothetical protein
MKMKKRITHDRRSQPGVAVFRPDLHRLRLRQGQGLPETGLAWMNFFLLYVSLPAPLFGSMSKTPFEELNNPPFLVAITLGTMCACPGLGRARRGARTAHRPDLLLRQHLSVFDRAAADRAD